ncbi:glycoside hydrolase family 68 protein [Microbacterium halotolerans]|uniref:glycoside hydrolase family 68 protein n=1 Tax=Microbacterium halotolerans TaxID=246613 RepID=UPI001F095661|nr:glycoside hydrolase family 68 protein [Microbacterium halotolerans]
MISLDTTRPPVFDLTDSWVWDFWFADDGEQYHLFFLYASRALHEPERRHHRASIGHAVSQNLTSWTRVSDAVVRSDAPAFDDLATWTGSVTRRPDGRWLMFYTGVSLSQDRQPIQRIGCAISNDLETWNKLPGPLFEPDPSWYVGADEDDWHDPTLRDPWVVRDPDGVGWHMLFTARSPHGPKFGRGVIGHATSPDLTAWTLRPAITEPSETGFGQLEVPQTEVVDGRSVLLFSCNPFHASAAHAGARAGSWTAPAESTVGGFALDRANPITPQGLYSARLVRRREGDQWLMFAFRDETAEAPFRGGIMGPFAVRWDGDVLVAE